jgi:hypothetical protein
MASTKTRRVIQTLPNESQSRSLFASPTSSRTPEGPYVMVRLSSAALLTRIAT